MQLLGFSLTIINIITPVMVLTLGSSYSIHMVSEYFAASAKDNPDPIGSSLKNISKTILIACLTTVFGFLSLLVSETQAFKEFGLSVSIGVIYCAILALTYLPAVLARMAPLKAKQTQKYESGKISRLTDTISGIDIKRWPVLLLIFVIIAGGFFYTKDRIGLDTNYMSYLPKSDPIVKSSLRIAEKWGAPININSPSTHRRERKGIFLSVGCPQTGR